VLQIEKYFKRRSAANGFQHHAYSVKRCLINQLEEAEVEIDLFQDGGQIKIKKNIDHHNAN
jgi:transposase